MFHYYVLNHKGCVMLLYLDLDELKMLSIALSNNNFEFIYEGSSIWERRDEFEALEKKINKEIEYYETTQ